MKISTRYKHERDILQLALESPQIFLDRRIDQLVDYLDAFLEERLEVEMGLLREEIAARHD